MINLHFVRDVGGLSSGWAIIPNYLDFFNSEFSQYIETFNNGFQRNFDEMASTLAHELGHNFGLYHTHHPSRLVSAAQNEINGTIENECYQEFANKNARNNFWACGNDHKKCHKNGDFLCDTPGDPGLSHGNTVWETMTVQSIPTTEAGHVNSMIGVRALVGIRMSETL